MKALVYKQFGEADKLVWQDNWPEPTLDSESVIIKSIAGGLNPKDVLLRKGMFSKTLACGPLPKVSGMDIAGEIIAVGEKVKRFRVGDRVFGMTNHFAGGLHCEIAKLHQSELTRAPTNITIEEASTVPLAAQTALQALVDCANIKEGSKVLINGASGGVGHFAVQIAKALDAEVHATCGKNNLAFVESLGADFVYDYKQEPANVIALKFDIIFDVFGKLSRNDFRRQLNHKGVYVSTVPKLINFWGEALGRLGISNSCRLVEVKSKSDDLEIIKDLIEAEKVRPFLEKAYPVEKAADAHRHIETKHTVGKICLTFT